MHVYIVDKYQGYVPVYAADQAGVKAEVRIVPADARHDVRIRLVDIDTSKKSLVAILNGQIPQGTVLRQWRIGGARGGKLIELKAGEE